MKEIQNKRSSLEEQIHRLVCSNGTSLSEIASRIEKLIKDNLTEALTSKSEFIREKAKQINE
jgi:hypothetical protein